MEELIEIPEYLEDYTNRKIKQAVTHYNNLDKEIIFKIKNRKCRYLFNFSDIITRSIKKAIISGGGYMYASGSPIRQSDLEILENKPDQKEKIMWKKQISPYTFMPRYCLGELINRIPKISFFEQGEIIDEQIHSQKYLFVPIPFSGERVELREKYPLLFDDEKLIPIDLTEYKEIIGRGEYKSTYEFSGIWYFTGRRFIFIAYSGRVKGAGAEGFGPLNLPMISFWIKPDLRPLFKLFNVNYICIPQNRKRFTYIDFINVDLPRIGGNIFGKMMSLTLNVFYQSNLISSLQSLNLPILKEDERYLLSMIENYIHKAKPTDIFNLIAMEEFAKNNNLYTAIRFHGKPQRLWITSFIIYIDFKSRFFAGEDDLFSVVQIIERFAYDQNLNFETDLPKNKSGFIGNSCNVTLKYNKKNICLFNITINKGFLEECTAVTITGKITKKLYRSLVNKFDFELTSFDSNFLQLN